MECYDHRYCTFPIKDIETISAIAIKRNKRNGRPQEIHMKIISSTRDVLYPEGNWRNRNGRPNKKMMIIEYIEKHPEESVSEVSKALGVSRTTVYKYKEDIMKKKEDVDYTVYFENGESAVIEMKKNQEELSEYDQMRLERLKKYQEKVNQLQNEKIDGQKGDKIQ